MKAGVNLLNFGPAATPDSLARWTAFVESLGFHLAMEDLSKLCLASGVAARLYAGSVPLHPQLQEAFPQRCLELAPAERLSFAPDCGLSQTARWAAKQKLKNMVEGVRRVRKELSL